MGKTALAQVRFPLFSDFRESDRDQNRTFGGRSGLVDWVFLWETVGGSWSSVLLHSFQLSSPGFQRDFGEDRAVGRAV